MKEHDELLPGTRFLAGSSAETRGHLTTMRWRHSTLRGLGMPWVGRFHASCVDLAHEVGQLLAKFGLLPAIALSAVEKQSEEIK